MSLKAWRKLATRAGWRVERTGSGHWSFKSPDLAVAPIIVASTPSDHRSMLNARAALRRAGLDL